MPKRRKRSNPATPVDASSRPRAQLWTCPNCGRQFGARNKQHSCGHYDLDDHFAGKDPGVRVLFDLLFKTLEGFGPVTAHPTKTRIVFQAETQFAAVVTRRRWLEGYLWLKRRAAHPAIQRIEMGVFRDYGHVFRLKDPADLDQALAALLQEAYVLGC